MTADSIATALVKLEAGTITERNDGLGDLKRLLRDDILGDDVFHKTFECIYQIVSKHRTAFLKSSTTKTARGSARLRLEVAGAALRLAVEAGTTRIRFRTALSVLDHISDTLSLPDGSLCEPLKNDYLKSFRILLDDAPRGEHMRPKQWQAYVDFALQCMSTILEDPTSENDATHSREASLASRNDRSLSVRLSQRSGRSINKEKATLAEEVVAALKSLASLTNARVMTRAEAIAETLQEFLAVSKTGQEDAFGALNSILSVSLAESVAFCRSLVSGLIPVMRRLWSSRSGVLREQMLITLFTCRHLFVAPTGPWDPIDAAILEPLLTDLMSDYGRNDKDLLQFDDMQPLLPSDTTPLQIRQFGPLRVSARAVNSWMMLIIIASLIVGLSRAVRQSSPGNELDETPRKRRKVQSHLDEMLELAAVGAGQEKLNALQIILFLFDQPFTAKSEWIQGLSRLSTDLNNEDPAIQTWVFLIYSRLALDGPGRSSQTPGAWLQVWDAARRAVTVASTSRSACHLLNTLLETETLGNSMNAGLLESTLFGNGNSGPPSITDSSLILMTSIMHSKSVDNERDFEALCLKIIGWLKVRWSLASNLDRLHNSHLVAHVQPQLLYSLLASMCGFSTPSLASEDWSPAHSSFKAAMMASNSSEFVQYLLSVSDSTTWADGPGNQPSRQLDLSTFARLFRVVVELLVSQLSAFMLSWKIISSERTSNIGSDIVEIVSVASTVASAFWTRCSAQESASKQPAIFAETRRILIDFIDDQNNLDVRRELAKRVCASVVAVHTQICQSGFRTFDTEHRAVITSTLDLARRSMENTTVSNLTDPDFLDDEQWESQATQSSQEGVSTAILRLDIPLCQNTRELLARNIVQLSTALELVKSQGTLDAPASTLILDEILALDAVMLMGARGAVREFLAMQPGISREDAHRLIERMGETFLQQEVFERCESALCFCLEVLRSLVDLWVADEDDDLAAASFEVYDWFLNIALDKHFTSPRVLSALADLLDSLLLKNQFYGGEDVPSPRTSLLKILEVSDHANQYRLADKLTHIFDKYVLTQHEAIFDDVVGKLPADPSNKEGIAVRLYIVSHLGARWHTVIRQATYSVFETVAHVPVATNLAHDCILRMCKMLGLNQPRQLFKLFSSQIFYTWLSQDTFAVMPFQAFGYASLQEMVQDNIAELVGQTALRGMSNAEELARLAGTEWNFLLVQNFAYAEAYTLASETSLPKQERLYDGSEKLMRKRLGSGKYLDQLRENLPNIIVLLVLSIQDDRGVEKALQSSVLAFWQEIADHSGPQSPLPLSQQPCFRARCLPEELNYICSRLELQQEDVWTPALMIYVFRQLLDKARPALGPLHTCSILRKIRITISLAGPAALRGYPLEMMLHSLRPYLTLFECAGDAMGIYRFLLRHGAPYLSGRPSFIAGLGVAIFASLTGFITSSQESTTQESQFVATMTQAQEFRVFLSQYLESLQLQNTTVEALQTYRSIIQHAKAIKHHGNSSESTSEGRLLYALLTDQSSQKSLLSNLHFELSIGILCQHFTRASDHSEDILRDDKDASRVLRILHGLLTRLELAQEFRIWAAQVFGRGFVMHGLAYKVENKKPATGVATKSTERDDRDRAGVPSYTSIVRHLLDLLWKSDYPASTSLENTLQLVFTKLSHLDEGKFLEGDFDESLAQELSFNNFTCPSAPLSLTSALPDQQNALAVHLHVQAQNWVADVLTQISDAAATDPILGVLKQLIRLIPQSADVLLPYAVHLILLSELNSHQLLREKLSTSFSEILAAQEHPSGIARPLILKALLYLRECRIPGESHLAQRNSWLEVDLCHAAMAASDSQMWHEALLFLELHHSQALLQTGRSSRRSFAMIESVPPEVVSRIYENVDDPDFFYGKHQTYDLQSIISKMSHEGASQKSLSFHSAMLDSQLRVDEHDVAFGDMARSTAAVLDAANMQGIADAVRQRSEAFLSVVSMDQITDKSRWDLLSSSDLKSSTSDPLSLLQSVYTIPHRYEFMAKVDQLLLDESRAIKLESADRTQAYRSYSKLAILSETRQIISAASSHDLETTCAAIGARNKMVRLAEFEVLSPILAGREAAFAAIRRHPRIQRSFSLSLHQALLFEVQVTRQSLDVASSYDTPQFCLNRAMYLEKLSGLAHKVGLNISVAVKYDLARTLWAQEETSASIGHLEDLRSRKDFGKQAIDISRADVLTDLGHKIAEARLEKPDEIIERYLAPAIQELQGPRTGPAAGRVFHNFAAFCDMQLQDADNLDDFTRISKIRERKTQEVRELARMVKNSKAPQQKQKLESHLNRAANWLKLDEEEWKRVSTNRQSLILQCLENYLLSMKASDDYSNDTLRFVALWLNQAESPTANAAVHKHIASIATIKFAPLINQLASRLLDIKDDFQRTLKDLIFRICSDHPYHSLYQMFATSKSKAPPGDDVAASRWTAANKLTERVRQHSTSSVIWTAVHNTCVALNKVAMEFPEKPKKTEPKTIQLRKLQGGPGLEAQITKPTSKIPPPTTNIALRPDRDYSNVPTSTSIEPEVSIATGVSAPKIATIKASDGSRHKLLLKGGNDDLRQDAIMEQVFEQVSRLLKEHRTTRQRNLGIRTYKVIPLTKNSGIIEFVQNTIPLNEYLMPAHERYYPKDYKQTRARQDIADAQKQTHDKRVRAYQTVIANFHPIMRFFFMEKFPDPDEWFYKRLNYSRSTAAVSILGHVLGLGDRHGHNILLDEETGEVVHIDLGVAFEAGRVLPIPEVVPFRLTRDLVDGMGLTGVEGVFRRCCNFTLEALRRDQEAMMTILDVLRYDPLYSWSISPLRLQKMQENNEQAAAEGASMLADDPSTAGVTAARREETEPNEADRALTIVAKKLGKALSVEATVNELIRQATDERNLAVLYGGWAAYA